MRFCPDTIDLQAHDAPSAQIHHRPTPDGSTAPHQAETLREVAAETAEENLRSPRLSWNPDPDDLQQHALALDPAIGGRQNGSANIMHASAQQDALAIAQNGGLSGHEADDGDLDGDAEVDMDDDMMDKISSSPSIEDGGSLPALPTLYTSKPGFPPQPEVLRRPSSSPSVSDARSSSPYLDNPDHMPLGTRGQEEDQFRDTPLFFSTRPGRHHHPLYGEFDESSVEDDRPSIDTFSTLDDSEFEADGFDADGEDGAQVFEGLESEQGPDRQREFEIQNKRDRLRANGDYEDDNDGEMTFPYESSEDDDGDFSIFSDARFVDSGWGGECLQDTEDIDFEFVYALHTFVATVEGQANATKGDTMVLLDDSNSYWWLVRIVKDSTIGGL